MAPLMAPFISQYCIFKRSKLFLFARLIALSMICGKLARIFCMSRLDLMRLDA